MLRIGLLLFFVIPMLAGAQDPDTGTIHRLESAYYKQFGDQPTAFYDSLQGFRSVERVSDVVDTLNRRVFGYHPYWGGSNYLNYRWDLLSDICHFSYEVDPATGLPVSTHDWETAAVIDTAMFYGVKVHLCVTLFSGHGTFFTNPEARQTLIDQIIALLDLRDAHGVNMDVEALPSVHKEAFMDFMIDLDAQLEDALPEAELSIAAPAVNWSNKFNIPALNEIIDFFMIMGYDYHWGGSSLAGPVSPLFPMVYYSTYCFNRTLSYYLAEGVPAGKIIMGVPYYAYQWKTEGPLAPSATLGQGNAFTYRNIRDNTSGHYAPENKRFEPNSFGPYYSFEANGWNQCFLDDVYSMGKKLDAINRRNLAGVGIWALGYDNGYDDFWNLLKTKFGSEPTFVHGDTLFDSGGPAFDYFDNESYFYSIRTSPGTKIYLSFSYLDTEEAYDTLWLYDGPDQQAELIGTYSGNDVPELIISQSNALTMRFYSDAATTDAGWRAVYDTLPVSGIGNTEMGSLKMAPNPAHGLVRLIWSMPGDLEPCVLSVYDAMGKCIKEIDPYVPGTALLLNVSTWVPGIYTVRFQLNGARAPAFKMIVQ